jgi:histidine ammonia-lyase
MVLVMMGEGEATVDGKRMSGAEALRQAAIAPITLQAKEGLALINGTHVMTALGVQAVHDATDLLKTAQIASTMSLEALRGTDRPFTEKMHLIRPYPGQLACARNIRLLLEGSEILHAPRDRQHVQDAYTLRCMPQVYGASRDAIDYVRQVILTELNAVTDNPLIFAEDGEVISGGNFHGQPLALALDFLGIAVAEIGDISERTIDRLVNPHYSELPPFLVKKEGLNSGFMITQYTAAALVSENKVLAHPASVDSIPTSAGQEDHVSMGTIAARKASAIVRNVERIIAIEFLCATQGLEFHRPLRPGRGVQRAYEVIRESIPPLEEDRPLYTDLEQMIGLVQQRRVLQAVEEVVGPLQ